MIWLYAISSVIIVSLISLIGILTISIQEKKMETFMMYFVSFAVGGLLGGIFFHLIPEALEEGFKMQFSFLFLAGLLVFFVVETLIHWRHHHHSHMFKKKHKSHKHEIKPVAAMNLIGDALHNFTDGIIIGASYLVSIPVGVATTIGVVLHEIPQEIGDFAVLVHAGFTRKKALMFNLIIAFSSIVGAVAAILIGSMLENFAHLMLIFTAGGFMYIAAVDLMPELHVEPNFKKAIFQLFYLFLGLGVMYGLTFLQIA